MAAIFSTNQNYSDNFGRGSPKDHLYQIISWLELNPNEPFIRVGLGLHFSPLHCVLKCLLVRGFRNSNELGHSYYEYIFS